MGYEIWTDPLLGWIGAAGTLTYAVHIHRDRSRSRPELMLLLLLYTLAALFISRGFYWLTEDPRLQVPSFVPATVLPLVVTLFVEALLRRHVPLGLKILAAGGSLVCFVLNLVPLVDRDTLWTISKVVTLGTFAWLALVIVTRGREGHSPSENRLISDVATALAAAFFLALTDLGLGPAWVEFRLGGLGGLIFVYVLVRLTDADEASMVVLRELVGIAVRAVIVTVTFAVLLPDLPVNGYVAIFLVSLAFVLLYTILGRLHGLRRDREYTSFFRWLLDSKTSTLEDLLEALERLPFARDHHVLREHELDLADPAAMADALCDAGPVSTVSSLRAARRRDGPDRDGLEQLIALLQENRMTHVTLLSARPYTFLLLNLPQFASAHNPVLEIALLHKFAGLLPRRP